MNKNLNRGLAVLPLVALAFGAAALGSTAFGGSAGLTAPAFAPAAVNEVAAPGLAPTTTSRDWQETSTSPLAPRRRA